ncbi:MAG: hypothetical protein SPK96_05770 [Bacteroidaceae bacterium]|nr:hypothetical protein [Bacteroidaceae bacterium]
MKGAKSRHRPHIPWLATAASRHQGAGTKALQRREEIKGRDKAVACRHTAMPLAHCRTQGRLPLLTARMAVGRVLGLASLSTAGADRRGQMSLTGMMMQAHERHEMGMVMVWHSRMNQHGQHRHQHDPSGQPISQSQLTSPHRSHKGSETTMQLSCKSHPSAMPTANDSQETGFLPQ